MMGRRETSGKFLTIPSTPVRIVPVEAATNVLVFMMSEVFPGEGYVGEKAENEDGKGRKQRRKTPPVDEQTDR